MKLYGLDVYGKNWNTRGCCPGHDLFSAPSGGFNTRASSRKHREDTKLAHRLGRHIGKQRLSKEIKEEME